MKIPANYAFSAHHERIRATEPQPSATQVFHRLALVDAGQVIGLAQRVQKIPAVACWPLYEDTFARGAMALSPLLIELPSDPWQATHTIEQLDGLCAQCPIMSLIQTPLPPAQWLQHLQMLLRIEMDGSEYLWRLADTQMLEATVSILTADQRAMVLGKCHAWWIVKADGTLMNLAASTEVDPIPTQALSLDTDQERRLLAAAAPHMLASQLRSMDMTFKSLLSHAEQSQFAMECVVKAKENFIDEDSELLPWALSAWQVAQVDLPCPLA